MALRSVLAILACVLLWLLPGHALAESPAAPQLRGVRSFAVAIGSGDLAGDVARRLALRTLARSRS